MADEEQKLMTALCGLQIRPEFPFELIDTEEGMVRSLEALSRHKEVAFDAEGVNLGRNGKLTVATFLGIDFEDTAYVVDVQLLGPDSVFGKKAASFRSILEDPTITKATFDCRTDSDALFHQFNITLRGTLELQVLDQAVRIQQGTAPPKLCPYVVQGGIPFLQSMVAVATRLLEPDVVLRLGLGDNGPHKQDPNVWGKRPLTIKAVSYAANDVHTIKALLIKLRSEEKKTSHFCDLSNAVKVHSARYEGMFRDRPKAISYSADKGFIREEHAIVELNELPATHPCLKDCTQGSRSMGLEKWLHTEEQLRSGNTSRSVFNDVQFILQHDEWYTDEGRAELKRLARAYPHFTTNQRGRIENPPPLRQSYDNRDDY